MNYMSSPYSSYRYSESLQNPAAVENAKRPFIGIPNDYPNYEIDVWSDNTECFLRIDIPENNPFFNGQWAFSIKLTSDISPYGTGTGDEEAAIIYRYDYGRRMLPNVDLLTLSVEMPQSPEVAERINSQLKVWTDGFSAESENIELLNALMKWYTDEWEDEYFTKYAYKLQPAHREWGDYLSVSYPLHRYDGPMVKTPVFDAICFDITTGETVDLTKHLPSDLPYSTSVVFDPIASLSFDFSEKNMPVEGYVVTSAWLLGMEFGMYVTEPDGTKLQINFWDWEQEYKDGEH